jgi:hypothetical protein
MSENNKTFSNEMAEKGFAVVAEVFSKEQIEGLLADLQGVSDDAEARRRGGTRNLLSHSSILALATCGSLRNLAEPILGEKSRPVRAILFDKTPEANWKVPWHQDLSIRREQEDRSRWIRPMVSQSRGHACSAPP